MTFAARVTGTDRVLISWDGRVVVTLAGGDARQTIHRLESARSDEEAQLVLAKATGNFKRGNER